MVLVASPVLLAGVAGEITIDRLTELPCLSMDGERDEVSWELIGPGGETRVIQHRPRLICTSFDVLRATALAGVGVALLPEHTARASIASGQLVHLLPEWHSAFGIIHAVFSTRKQLVPAVRALIDHLVTEVPQRAFAL